jgi:chromosome segregation ATPase
MAADGKNPPDAGGGEEAKTTIDSLPELLRQKGKMELSRIAAALNVSEAIAEDWSKILEGGGMVKITYEMGKMYVEPPSGATREQEAVTKMSVESQKDALEVELAKQRGDLDTFSKKLAAMAAQVKINDTAFKEMMPQIQVRLDNINKIYGALVSENQKVLNITKTAETTYENINTKIAELYTKVDTLDTDTVDKAKAELLNVQNALNKAAELESQFALLTKSKDKALQTIRKSMELQQRELVKEEREAEKSINAQITAYKAQLEASTTALKSQSKTTSSVAGDVVHFTKDKEMAKKSLVDARDTFDDEYARVYRRMKAMEESLGAEMSGIMKELDELKSSFGNASTTYDKIQSSKDEIDALQRRIVELETQAENVLQNLRSVSTMKAPAETKAKAVLGLKKEKDKIKKATDEVDDRIDEVEKKMGAG